MEIRGRILVTVVFVKARVGLHGCKVRSGIQSSTNRKCVEFLQRTTSSGSGTDTWYLSPCRVSPHIQGNVAEPSHRCPQKRLEGVHRNCQVPAGLRMRSRNQCGPLGGYERCQS